MITITPDNQIDRDGEIIGSIIGGIAWMKSKPAGRIAGQIRQAAGINGLKFEVSESSEESPPLSAVQVVDTLNVTEPAAVRDDAAAGNAFHVPAGWGTPGTAYFARCFINHHGPDTYSQYCKDNGI
jgi:hypothetical protein